MELWVTLDDFEGRVLGRKLEIVAGFFWQCFERPATPRSRGEFKLLGHEGTTMPAFSTIVLFCTVLGLTLAGAPAGYARELETVKLVFQSAIPNIPGKNLVALVVNYPPGG